MIDTDNLDKARSLLKKESSLKIVKAKSPEFNRKLLEKAQFDVLLGTEELPGKNSLKKTDSGFDHIQARIAAKKKTALGIDISSIRKKEKKAKAKTLTNIIRNIRLCRKSGVKIALFNFNNELNAKSLLISLGASSQQASQACLYKYF